MAWAWAREAAGLGQSVVVHLIGQNCRGLEGTAEAARSMQ